MGLFGFQAVRVTIHEIPTVEVKDHPVGSTFKAPDGTTLTVVSTNYSDPDNRKHTLTRSDGEAERTYGKNWRAWAVQYGGAAA